MKIMGFNKWETDVPADALIAQTLRFADAMRDQGIAELRGTWIAPEEKLMWCAWDTDDLDGLQAAFFEMNKQSGLVSTLTTVDTFFTA